MNTFKNRKLHKITDYKHCQCVGCWNNCCRQNLSVAEELCHPSVVGVTSIPSGTKRRCYHLRNTLFPLNLLSYRSGWGDDSTNRRHLALCLFPVAWRHLVLSLVFFCWLRSLFQFFEVSKNVPTKLSRLSSWTHGSFTFTRLPCSLMWSCDWALINGMLTKMTCTTSRPGQ